MSDHGMQLNCTLDGSPKWGIFRLFVQRVCPSGMRSWESGECLFNPACFATIGRTAKTDRMSGRRDAVSEEFLLEN